MLPPRDKILVPIITIDEILPARRSISYDGRYSGEWVSEDGTVYLTFTLQQFNELLEHEPKRLEYAVRPTILQALQESIVAFR